jgi:hypothetical protein
MDGIVVGPKSALGFLDADAGLIEDSQGDGH